MKLNKLNFLLILLTGFFLVAGSISGVHAGDVKNLKFASPVPPQSFYGKYQQWWADELEKRTNGRLKVKIYWMESLVKWKDMLQGLKFGATDIGLPSATYHPSDLGLLITVDPPYNVKDYWAAMRALLDTQNNEPNLKAEMEKAGFFYVGFYQSGFQFIQTKKPWKSLAELKGKTFRTYGGAKLKMLEYMGFNPVFMSYSEIYEAMDRGTVYGNADGAWQLSDAFKHYEVGKYVVMPYYGSATASGIAMSYKVFNSLPADIQAVIRQLQLDSIDRYAQDLFNLEEKVMEKWKTKYGVTIREMTPEDDKFARECGAKAREEFLAKLEAEGKPAKKLGHIL